MKPIKSVIELAKYKTGDVAYWVTLRALGPNNIQIPENEGWMAEHHPKVLYERKITNAWNRSARLPALHHIDFEAIVTLLTSKLVVEAFTIETITRSHNTGEFFYKNSEDEWMPESFLFDSTVTAQKERDRILKLCQKWAQG